jgi:hypothetical protein
MSGQNQTPILLASQVDELDRQFPGDMVRGYSDGISGAEWPDAEVSPAYEHGRRNGVNDKHGIVDVEQRMLAEDVMRQKRFNDFMAEHAKEKSCPAGVSSIERANPARLHGAAKS